MTTVTIVDQREHFRGMLAAALAEEGFAIDWPSDIKSWSADERRVAIIDLTHDHGRGLLRELRESNSDVIVLGLVDGESAPAYAEALRNGASNVVSKHEHPSVIVDAVQAALTGRVVLPASVVSALTRANGLSAPRPELSDTDRKLLRLMAAGLPMAKIAREVHASERTVYREAKRLIAALGATTRAEAMVKAAQWHLLSQE